MVAQKDISGGIFGAFLPLRRRISSILGPKTGRRRLFFDDFSGLWSCIDFRRFFLKKRRKAKTEKVDLDM